MRWVVDKLLLNLRSHMEFREAFLAQVLGMIINDIFWAAAAAFLGSFSLYGMNSKLYVIGFGSAALCDGLYTFFFGGLLANLSAIYDGSLDAILTKPGNKILHIALSKMNVEGLGDVVVGITVLLILKASPIVWLVSFISSLLFFFYTLFSFSLHFFIYEPSGRLHRTIVFLFPAFALWPSFALPSFVKIIPYFLIPGAWASFGAVEISLGKRSLLHLLFVLFFWAVLGIFAWKKGLKRYESSTFIGIIE